MGPLLSEISYGTFADYSPRGVAEPSVRSRTLCGGIKGGRPQFIERAIDHLAGSGCEVLTPFLNPGVTLVPVPKSAPLTSGAFWPSNAIADALRQAGLGGEVLSCIRRFTAVAKSATARPGERPLVPEHYGSLGIEPQLGQPSQITLVDDGLTMGRTMFGCALHLHEAYPDAQIRAFAVFRTLGLIDETEKVSPSKPVR